MVKQLLFLGGPPSPKAVRDADVDIGVHPGAMFPTLGKKAAKLSKVRKMHAPKKPFRLTVTVASDTLFTDITEFSPHNQ